MSELMTPDERLSIKEVGMDDSATSRLAPRSLNEVVRFAEVMAKGGIALPKIYRNNPGLCMAVTIVAVDLGMNPFMIAPSCYQVNDQLAYDAKLVTAIINARANLAVPLKYEYFGEGTAMWVRVTGSLKGNHERSYDSPPIEAIPNKRSPLWKNDPQQQLGYFGSRSWGRKYCPEVIMGLYTPDDLHSVPSEPRDVTSEWNPLQDPVDASVSPEQKQDELSEAIDNAEVEVIEPMSNDDRIELDWALGEIEGQNTPKELTEWQSSFGDIMTKMHPDAKGDVRKALKDRARKLEKDDE